MRDGLDYFVSKTGHIGLTQPNIRYALSVLVCDVEEALMLIDNKDDDTPGYMIVLDMEGASIIDRFKSALAAMEEQE